MVMVTHIRNVIFAGVNQHTYWSIPRGRQVGLDHGLSQLRKNQKRGTLNKYHNEFNLIDEKLCQWKDSS